eukprot:CAMPEP_0183485198 /NCGR_PEP_ID=MMETSP0370-20130417/179306_1 /TAXON_ID=268820 /ORGANISM="Peridinium aciculiferum, Strain PAER-2" /LENGTH=384 /DNA_ID=CAMNT_0025678495 /DNA_START=58 /DNA_END=1212 /DNA_ORIENTATION=+
MCEVQTHAVPKRLARQFEGLFPGRNLGDDAHMIVTIALQTKHRQSAMSPEMLEERAQLFGELVGRMQRFQSHFESAGHWCDFVDPATGAPFYTDSATTLVECDERYRKLGFEILELGCCRSLCNKTFGQCLVMTSAFIQAPEAEINAALYLLEGDGVASADGGAAADEIAKSIASAEASGGVATAAAEAAAVPTPPVAIEEGRESSAGGEAEVAAVAGEAGSSASAVGAKAEVLAAKTGEGEVEPAAAKAEINAALTLLEGDVVASADGGAAADEIAKSIAAAEVSGGVATAAAEAAAVPTAPAAMEEGRERIAGGEAEAAAVAKEAGSSASAVGAKAEVLAAKTGEGEVEPAAAKADGGGAETSATAPREPPEQSESSGCAIL